MDKTKLEKIDFENCVSGGPLDHMDDLDNALINQLDTHEGKDFMVHLEYFPEQNRYGFAIYRQK